MFRDKFRKDLENIRADEDLLARTRRAAARLEAAGRKSAASPFLRRKNWLHAAAAAVCCLIILGGAAAVYLAMRDARSLKQETSATLAAETAGPTGETEAETAGNSAPEDEETAVDSGFGDADIRRYGTYGPILSILEKSWNSASAGYRYFGTEDGAAATEAAGQASGKSDTAMEDFSSNFSQTNIQVAGVDEADIIKNDGEFVYYLQNACIYILDVRDPNDMTVAATITEPEGEVSKYYNDMFFDPDTKTLSVISSAYSGGAYAYGMNDIGGDIAAGEMPYRQFTSLDTYDVSDPSSPEKIRTFAQDGYYVSSRRIGDMVYLVTSKNLYYGVYADARDMIPSVSDGSGAIWNEIPALDIYVVCPDCADAFTVVSAVDSRNPDKSARTQAVLGSGSIVYSTADTLFVAGTMWDTDIYRTYDEFYADMADGESAATPENDVYKTKILSFSIRGGSLEARASGTVNGTILNQYALDERDGYLRIATTSGGWTAEKSNNVFVLDADLDVVSGLTGLAPGESIYAVRFAEERIYLVTFEQIDPFFVIDASDPRSLKVIGELKIPGYSNYMQVIGDHLVLAIGNTTYSEGQNVIPAGLKIAVFDVSDPGNPIEKSHLIYGDSYGYSDVQFNSKALLLDLSRGLVGLPASFDQKAGGYGSEYISGFLLLRIDKAGNLSHLNIFKNYESYISNGIGRGIYIGDTLFLFGYNEIAAFSLRDYAVLGTLTFAEPFVDEPGSPEEPALWD